MARNDGTEFERLAERVMRNVVRSNPQTTVTRDVMVDGPDGRRQVDIVLTTPVGPFELMTIISCKDYQRAVSISKVDELHSVAQDLKASKAVVISRKGCSANARRKAKRLGVEIFRIDDLAGLADIVSQVPVLVRQVKPTEFGITIATVPTTADSELDPASLLRAIRTPEFISALRSNGLDDAGRPKPLGRYELDLSDVRFGRSVFTRNGTLVQLEVARASYQLTEKRFFGYLSDMDAIGLQNESSELTAIYFGHDEIELQYEQLFSEVPAGEALPAHPALDVLVLADAEGESDPIASVDYGDGATSQGLLHLPPRRTVIRASEADLGALGYTLSSSVLDLGPNP